MSTASTPTATQERPTAKPPWPKSEEELLAYVREMAAWPAGASDAGEGYGRCVYAMAFAAVATFNYIAGRLGVTGFQASAAEMQFLAESRGLEHGFLVLDGSKLLYPQYDLEQQAREWIEKTLPRLAPAAREKLAQDGDAIHPEVRARWEYVASLEPVEASRG